MRLHYLPGTAAMAPHATLAEIGAPYELVRVELDGEGRVTSDTSRSTRGGGSRRSRTAISS